MINWSVPREWSDERCFIIAGGESVKSQEHLILKLKGRVIAIKQSVALRPDADVMFIAGKDDGKVCEKFFPKFKGRYIIARGPYKDIPKQTKILERTTTHKMMSRNASQLAGLDAGTSAINLAFLFGAKEIILLGYDMTGGRWLNGRYHHHLPFPPQRHFDLHMAVLPELAADLKNEGIEVINCSPGSAVECFRKEPLEKFL